MSLVLPERLDDATIRAAIGALVGAVGLGRPDDLDDTQGAIVDAVVRQVFGRDFDFRAVSAVSEEAAGAAVTDPTLRTRVVQLMVALELVLHPLPPEVERSVERYAAALEVDEPMVHAARRYADDQLALMYADIQRNSWYTEETVRESVHGRLWELIRSKVAYTGIVPDAAIEEKWTSLRDLPPGTWGRAVADFYEAHRFPFPGSNHGITEVSARHDWVHVLAGYPPNPEGEIDVFTFIAAAMDDPRGFTLLVTALALFQDYSIRHVALKRVAIARADALEAPKAPEHFAEAMHRGFQCRVDPMAIDAFDYADRDLEELRREWNVLPKGD